MSDTQMSRKEVIDMANGMIKDAKAILESVKEILNENSIYSFEQDLQTLYTELTGEYPDWYNSGC